MRLHLSIERQIDREFTKGPRRSRPRLFEHLTECGTCAAYYDRYLELESALCIRPEARAEARAEASSAPTLDEGIVSVFAVERVKSAVLNEAPKSAGEIFTARYRRIAVAFGAVASVALVAFVLFLRGAPASDKTSLTEGADLAPVYIASRGSGKEEQSGVGVRVFRTVESGTRVRENDGLSIDDVITFTYTRVAKGKGYLTLFGVQPSGDIRWYYPGYKGEKSVRIHGEKVDEPLGDGISLWVNHEPGPLRIVSIFSVSPIDKGVIESSVAKFFQSDRSIDDLSPMPIRAENTKIVEYSILLEIGDASNEGR